MVTPGMRSADSIRAASTDTRIPLAAISAALASTWAPTPPSLAHRGVIRRTELGVTDVDHRASPSAIMLTRATVSHHGGDHSATPATAALGVNPPVQE